MRKFFGGIGQRVCTGPILDPKNGVERGFSLANGKEAEKCGRVPGSIRRGRFLQNRIFREGKRSIVISRRGRFFLQPVVKEFQPGRWFEPRAKIRCRTAGRAGRKSAFCVGRRGGDTAGRRSTPACCRGRSGENGTGGRQIVRKRKRGEKRCSEPFRAGSAQEVPFCGQKPGGLQKKRKRTKVRNGRAGKKETRSGRFLLARFGGAISKKQEGCHCCGRQKNAGKGRKRKATGSKGLERTEAFEKEDAIRRLRFGGREGVGGGVRRKRKGEATCKQKKECGRRVFANERKRA